MTGLLLAHNGGDNKNMYNLTVIYYGFLAMIAQLIVFRELAVLFYGNELFLGTFLASWLFWVGMGSFAARRLPVRARRVPEYFSYGFLAVSLLFPAIVLLIRASKSVFSFGEFIGPVGTVIYTFAVMSVLCAVIGSLFSLASAAAPYTAKRGTAVGRVYLFESLGAVIGGVIFTYLLIGRVPQFAMVLALSLGCILVSFALMPKKIFPLRVLPVLAALLGLFVLQRIEPAVNRFEWNKYEFIAGKEARNATLAVVKMGSITTVFSDGMLSASFPDPEGYEPAAHWPLLANAKPVRVLIIGDSSPGIVKEVLKHGPLRVDHAAADNSFDAVAGQFLEHEDIRALKDPAVHIHYGDPRIFIRDTKEKYDAVIINIPGVPNLKMNRYFTREFYGRISDILAPGGILGLSVVSSENYLSMATRIFNASVYNTLKSVFRFVEVIPGDNLMFLSGREAIDTDNKTFLERFGTRSIINEYFIPSYIEYKLDPARRAELKELLGKTPEARVNRDLKPTASYYFAGHWLDKFASPYRDLMAGAVLVLAVFAAFKKRRAFGAFLMEKEAVLIFVLGFIGMLLELTFLLSYQIISGNVYWRMGVLFASFMVGASAGSFVGGFFNNDSRRGNFLVLEGLTLAITGLSLLAARLLPGLLDLPALWDLAVFITLMALTGGILGAAFVIAGFASRGEDVMRNAGNIYASDLWGAALGALFIANFITPYCGVIGVLYVSAVIGVTGVAAVIARRPRGRRSDLYRDCFTPLARGSQ
ncbi:MAG: hypothetical protein HQL30_07540 [Candidatus Omnitrophica bacterium]|nr:hypothetical protein [Candidatus Omnitrophota bacterium]